VRAKLFHSLLAAAAFAIVVPSIATTASAQEHGHPPADMPIHEKFYSTWNMPDNPARSCCNKVDCYPTEATFRDGQWFARRREDGRFIPVPWSKVERNRDNPDGRNHVCMPPPNARGYPPDTIFCFALGSGV
jgi:hypothetical protein